MTLFNRLKKKYRENEPPWLVGLWRTEWTAGRPTDLLIGVDWRGCIFSFSSLHNKRLKRNNLVNSTQTYTQTTSTLLPCSCSQGCLPHFQTTRVGGWWVLMTVIERADTEEKEFLLFRIFSSFYNLLLPCCQWVECGCIPFHSTPLWCRINKRLTCH